MVFYRLKGINPLIYLCGRGSAVEHWLPKPRIASSNLVVRSIRKRRHRKGLRCFYFLIISLKAHFDDSQSFLRKKRSAETNLSALFD